jgi:hypothetical protein
LIISTGIVKTAELEDDIFCFAAFGKLFTLSVVGGGTEYGIVTDIIDFSVR